MMGRQTHEPKHLLDTTADQNIGNGVIIQPQLTGPTVIPQSNPDRLLALSGPSGTGQTTSIVMTASRMVGASNPAPGFPGPITGVVEFGNGGQFTKAEVDIPLGPFVGEFQSAATATEPQDGGIIVTVPTGVLRVYARYDNCLIQPLLQVAPSQSLAQFLGVPFLGPGGPVAQPHLIIPPEPVQAKAMAAYYSRHTSRAYRTHYCYVGDNSTGVPIAISPSGRGVPAWYCVPPFARSVKVLHMPAPGGSANLTVDLYDNTGNLLEGPISVPTGPSPAIPIVGTETIIGISSVNPAVDKVILLALCYEIGI
jgi:hypothetical protein